MAFESTVVARVSTRALLRWRPPDVSRRRELKAVAFNLGPALVGFAALAFLAPQSDWSQPVLLAALAACSAIAFVAEARLKAGNRVFFGANLVVALVALAVAGPIPALLIWLVPDLITRFVLALRAAAQPGLRRQRRQLRAGRRGRRPAARARRLAHRPRDRPLALRGRRRDVGDQLLLRAAHLRALLPALSTGVPDPRRVRRPGPRGARDARRRRRRRRPRRIDRRDRAGAAGARHPGPAGRARADRGRRVRRVPEPLGGDPPLLGGDRGRARGPARTSAASSPAPPTSSRHPPTRSRRRGWHGAGTRMPREAVLLALHAHERWAGNGRPAGLPAEAIPRGSRILAVAEEWAALTAAARPSSRNPRRSWRSPPSPATPSTRRSSRRPRASSATRRASPASPASSPRSTGFRCPGPCGARRCRCSSRGSSTAARRAGGPVPKPSGPGPTLRPDAAADHVRRSARPRGGHRTGRDRRPSSSARGRCGASASATRPTSARWSTRSPAAAPRTAASARSRATRRRTRRCTR